MNKTLLTVSTFLIGFGVGPVAQARPTDDPIPYAVSPVSDEILAETTAKALLGLSGNLRVLSDSDSNLFGGQVAEGSRIAMDNWWSQTGAALITSNLLASSPR